MDKDFYSEANVEAMYAKHMEFMAGIPFTMADEKNCENARQDIRLPTIAT